MMCISVHVSRSSCEGAACTPGQHTQGAVLVVLVPVMDLDKIHVELTWELIYEPQPSARYSTLTIPCDCPQKSWIT